MPEGLDVTPDSLRTTASAFIDAGGEVMGAAAMGGDGGGANIIGQGEHTSQHLSTQMFEPGAQAQQFVSDKLGQYGQAAAQMLGNCFALASALSIVADAYDTTDHAEALQFAFLQTDDRPAGLPSHIDGENTVFDDPPVAQDAPAPDVLTDSDGGYSTETTQNDSPAPGVRSHTETVTRDEEGNLVRVEHQVEHHDGTTSYHTDRYNKDGTAFERSDGWTMDSPQAPAPPPMAALEADIDATREKLEELNNR
ncbi:hypothetical protein JQS43_02855 [Natronosporangium hydrolyticum]|uniref:Uncharacterized protein n=1 Tax=Natronosporangium hydrolyticum TaxID=2811111 RepID=A0A895YMJ4_9ACTN|nr:hypothetical protein [Natronosporangium hydrolyticum]QSB15320.1 hypothetical protein JQS43_02855 [Natronosporangium hydrolyticum]